MKTDDLSKQLWKEAEKAYDSSGQTSEGANYRKREPDIGGMEIPMDLRKHCIEKEIKRLHHHTMLEYFRDSSSRDRLESKIACLDRIMDSWDFSGIRAAYPELAGGFEVPIRLLFLENREEIQIGGRMVKPLLQGKSP